jgi:hypothetical protein
MRELPLNGQPLRAENVKEITEMFGTEQWQMIHELRKADELAGH